MSLEEDKPMSFEEYAEWFERLAMSQKEQEEALMKYMEKKDEVEAEVSGEVYAREKDDKQIHDEELGPIHQILQQYFRKEKSSYRLSAESYQESLMKKFRLESKDKEYPWENKTGMEDPIERLRRLGPSDYGSMNYQFVRRSAQINMNDLRLIKEDLESLELPSIKDGKLVTTIELTRTKYAETEDAPSEQVDPLKIAWVKPYVYSPRHDIGILILFYNGDFRTYTQGFEYFKRKVQQVVGNLVVVGGKVPSLPWWDG